MAKLVFIEGFSSVYVKQLSKIGILNSDKYLERCGTKKGRDEIAEITGISSKLILEWANRADLARIKGVGSEYSELLQEVGVDTVPELANRNPVSLYQMMIEVNEEKTVVRKMPSVNQVTLWIEQAKTLPRVLHY